MAPETHEYSIVRKPTKVFVQPDRERVCKTPSAGAAEGDDVADNNATNDEFDASILESKQQYFVCKVTPERTHFLYNSAQMFSFIHVSVSLCSEKRIQPRL